DEYVEADIVEKQRAREIYETILREKRDPGLLEWTGGNVFKARVFPILGNSEKRIRISYTQVLPRTGNRYRYSYALQSELLRQHPLRELGIDVTISSMVPLTGVTSPTHPARIDMTANSARVEFTAQEYAPTRDFEVVVELGAAQSDVVMIPHQRGEDGYFMLQIAPITTTSESSTRDVLPDGQPLKLIVLADTSRSMDVASRVAQSEFVAALLSSLSPGDTFNLATCDVDCQWAFENPVPAEEGNIQVARKSLDDRVSLGWTDLDVAFASALKQSGDDGHVIYVGDGIVTTGDADAVAFTKRLQRVYAGHRSKMHAVAVNSRFESAVMKSIATLGDGSLHRISGEVGPAAVARQLLAELTQPATRILKVEFPGLMTARVYPEDFPRLPAGSQQIVMGRYLPSSDKSACQVVVTAQRGDETFHMSAPVSLEEAAEGNSFIPRLWARLYLDALLEQGSSAAIQDEIIALSEEYHIITPYTSLLVLETDADRERFKVKRRFQLRDGERFFATGRERVNYELMQQQMRQAGDWRIRLRSAVLRELAGLGRDADVERYGEYTIHRGFARGEWGRAAGRYNAGFNFDLSVDDFAGITFARDGKRLAPTTEPEPWDHSLERLGDEPGLSSTFFPAFYTDHQLRGKFAAGVDSDFGITDGVLLRDPELASHATATDVYAGDLLVDSREVTDKLYRGFDVDGGDVERFSVGFMRDLRLQVSYTGGGGFLAASKREYEPRHQRESAGLFARPSRRWAGETSQSPSWLGTLFPSPPPASSPARPVVRDSDWPAEARAIAESLLRTSQLAAIREGLEITRDTDYFQPRSGAVTSHLTTTAMVSPDQWLVFTIADANQTVVHACDSQRREASSRAFQLGRSRAATAEDLRQPPLDLSGYVLRSLEHDYPTYMPALETQGDGSTVLTLTHPLNEESVLQFVIDTDKHVVRSMESRQDGEVTASQAFGEFVEAAGAWWPTRIETFDARGRRTALITQRFQLHGSDAFAARVKELNAGRDQVHFLREPLAEMRAANKSIGDGKGTFEDHFAMLAHYYAIQQWDQVVQHLESLESLAKDKPGMCWVRDAVLNDARRREELRQRVTERAAELAQLPSGEGTPDQYFLAEYLWSQASGACEANESLALLDALKPVFDAQPQRVRGPKQRRQHRIDCLSRIGQPEQVLEMKKQRAVEFPDDAGAQQQYVQALVQARDFTAARTWLDLALNGETPWDAEEDESFRNFITWMYREEDRYEELVSFLTTWAATNPAGASAYQQLLSAMVKSGRIEEATELVDQWLEEGMQAGRLPKSVAGRLTAAVEFALGDAFELRIGRLDRRWREPLAKLVLFHAQQPTRPECVNQIMSHRRFQETEQSVRVRTEVFKALSDGIDALRIGHLQQCVDWAWNAEVDKSVWSAIAGGLRKRWDAETQPERKHALGQLVARVLQG
ncbi:MAG: hypothetical protein FJ276_23295, partial [Planctomycetes bacterium]|nr:hypothetical protein [Planctomycetota bacterium]